MPGRRKKGQGTVRQRTDGRWEGRYIVGYNDEGEAIQKSVFGKTKTEYISSTSRTSQTLKLPLNGLNILKIKEQGQLL